jgi:hypothetical protein
MSRAAFVSVPTVKIYRAFIGDLRCCSSIVGSKRRAVSNCKQLDFS